MNLSTVEFYHCRDTYYVPTISRMEWPSDVHKVDFHIFCNIHAHVNITLVNLAKDQSHRLFQISSKAKHIILENICLHSHNFK